MSAYEECAASICVASCRCHYRAPVEPWCDWCGRAIKQGTYLDEPVWLAVKGEERGYDPLTCEASEDVRHEPYVGPLTGGSTPESASPEDGRQPSRTSTQVGE